MITRLYQSFNGRRLAVWYAGFAVYAMGVALFSGPGLDRWWGTWAAGGYALAAAAVAWRPARGRVLGVALSVAGALVAPAAWLAIRFPAPPDVAVVARSAILLLHHGTPYLPTAALLHGGWLAYNPYLPVMAVFGLPAAMGMPGDTQPALIAVTFLLLLATFRITEPPRGARAGGGWRSAAGRASFGISCPVMALPLTMGITDPPVIALTCLALALLTRQRFGRPDGTWAALVLGVACAMKYTAWPALAVIATLVAVRDGPRACVKFTATTAGTAAGLVAALAPAALAHPASILANTVAYPLGLTAARSPAQSPLPGHLLATLGPAGHLAAIALLVTAGLATIVSLGVAPPATPARAARRIAFGLTALFALSPATRFGYFCYPLTLLAWAALAPGDLRLHPELAGLAAEPAKTLSANEACAPALTPRRLREHTRTGLNRAYDDQAGLHRWSG